LREIRLIPEPAKKLSFWNALHLDARPGRRVAMIALRKKPSLGEDLARTPPLKDDRATVFLVRDQVNLTFHDDKERDNRLPKVEKAFVRSKRSAETGGRR
jgi:hypothetical protein